jgi:hypothetical protein
MSVQLHVLVRFIPEERTHRVDHALAHAVNRLASHRGCPGIYPRSGRMGFVVDKVALGQVVSEYFGFPFQFSFHQLLHTHLSSGAGSIRQLVADVPSGLSLNPHPSKLKKESLYSLGRRMCGPLDHAYPNWNSCSLQPVAKSLYSHSLRRPAFG